MCYYTRNLGTSNPPPSRARQTTAISGWCSRVWCPASDLESSHPLEVPSPSTIQPLVTLVTAQIQLPSSIQTSSHLVLLEQLQPSVLPLCTHTLLVLCRFLLLTCACQLLLDSRSARQLLLTAACFLLTAPPAPPSKHDSQICTADRSPSTSTPVRTTPHASVTLQFIHADVRSRGAELGHIPSPLISKTSHHLLCPQTGPRA